MLSSHKFPEVYEALGINVKRLGCIMLDVDSTALQDTTKAVIPEEATYTSPDEEKFWIRGIVTDTAHVTLLYGLLENGNAWKPYVDLVLENKIPKQVEIDYVHFFNTAYEDEPYYCIIAHLKVTEELQEANDRLKFLPHINTFPGYKPHVTLAYVKHTVDIAQLVEQLNKALQAVPLRTIGINYGKQDDASKPSILFTRLQKALETPGVRMTEGRRKKIKARLKTFTVDEIIKAAESLAKSPWHMGDNPSKVKYASIDFLIRSDEKVDEWLNKETHKSRFA